jgi:hypothetical protein
MEVRLGRCSCHFTPWSPALGRVFYDRFAFGCGTTEFNGT